MLPGCDRASTLKLGERLREEISRVTIHQNLQVTISVGATTLEGEQPTTGVDLLRRADEALYRAKRGGRNQVASPAVEPTY